jgi:hypothetical protein
LSIWGAWVLFGYSSSYPVILVPIQLINSILYRGGVPQTKSIYIYSDIHARINVKQNIEEVKRSPGLKKLPKLFHLS